MNNSSAKGDIRHRVWELMHHTNALLVKYADVKMLAERGISYQQFMVLYMMNRLGTSATATQIAELLDRNPNTLSTILDRMEKGGLTKKVRDKKDRRFVRLVMTKRGENKLEKTLASGQEIIEKLAVPFSDQELKAYVSFAEKLLDQTYDVLVPRKVAQRLQKNAIRRAQSGKKAA